MLNFRTKAVLWVVFSIIIFTFFSSGCASRKPKSFIVTYDTSANWRVVEINSTFVGETDKIWKTLVDTISAKYDLEVLQKDSGYLRTSWKYTLIKRGRVSDKYRSRIVVKSDIDFTQLKIKVESNWLESQGWVTGFDTNLLEEVYSDIQGKLGRVISR